jgi:hypothetical protein
MSENQPNAGERPMSMKEKLLAQRRAEAEKAAAGAAATPTPAAAPAPAAKPASASAKPAPASTATKPAAPAAPKSPAPAASSAKPASASSTARPAGSRGSGPSSSVIRREASADVKREIQELRKKQDKWITYGWIVAGVLMAAAGTTYLVVQGKKKHEADVRNQYMATVEGFMKDMLKLDPNVETQAQEIIKLAESKRETFGPNLDGVQTPGWKDTWVLVEGKDVPGRVQALVGRAQSTIDGIKRQRELLAGLAAIENDVNNAGGKKPEELQALKRRLGEYEMQAGMGAEFEGRVSAAKVKIGRAYADRLFDEAQNLAVKGPGEARAALAAFAKAEDEFTALLDEAYTKRNQEAIAYVTPKFQSIIEESDKLAVATFTADYIAKIEARDILRTVEASKWGQDGLKGFRIDNGTLQAIGLDPGSKKDGVFSVGDLEKWRDFELEFDFTLVKGEAQFYFRLGKQIQSAEGFQANSGAEDWKAGESYTCKATLVGSNMKLEFSDNANQEPRESLLDWRRSRKGAFGVVVPQGSEIKITKMRLRLMRPTQ